MKLARPGVKVKRRLCDIGPKAFCDVGLEALHDIFSEALCDVGRDALCEVGPEALCDVGPEALHFPQPLKGGWRRYTTRHQGLRCSCIGSQIV